MGSSASVGRTPPTGSDVGAPAVGQPAPAKHIEPRHSVAVTRQARSYRPSARMDFVLATLQNDLQRHTAAHMRNHASFAVARLRCVLWCVCLPCGVLEQAHS